MAVSRAGAEHQPHHPRELVRLPWDDAVLDFHAVDRAVQTPSRWQVRRPLYQSSCGRRRAYERHIGPLLEAAEEAG
jgi:hypothetical protein